MNYKKISSIAYYFSLFANLLIVLGLYSSLSEYGFFNLNNSDSLYMASLYKDLFVDGNTLQGWDLNTAPLLFPNVLVFSIFNALTGNYQIAYLLHGLFQYFSILLIFNYLIFYIDKNVSKYVLASSNLLIGLFLLSFMLYDEAHNFINFLLPYHTGSFIVTVLCFIWLLKYINTEKSRYLILIFIVTIFTIISDRIFIVYFSISSFVTMALLLFFKQYPWRRLLLSMLTIAISCILSVIILNLILNTHYVSFLETKLVVKSRIVSSFKIMLEQYYTYLSENTLKGTLFKLSIVALMFLFIKIYSYYRRMKNIPANNLSITFMLFSFIFAVGIWLAPAVNGNYLGYDCIRYNIWVVVLLIAFFPFLLYLQFNNKIVNTTLICLVAITFIASAIKFDSIKDSKYSLRSFLNYYPELADQADSLALKYNLKKGIGDYWAAKQITMFSKTGLKIYSVYDDLNPYTLSSNRNWYFDFNEKKRGKDFNFIVMNITNSYLDSVRNRFKNDSIIETSLGKRYKLLIVPPFHYEYGVYGIVKSEKSDSSSYYNKIQGSNSIKNDSIQ